MNHKHQTVGQWASWVYEQYGNAVGTKFSQLMREWDGSNDYRMAYYTEAVIQTKITEAREWVEQNSNL